VTERELIEDCLSGNAKSQELLFQRFAGIMMTICRRYACDQPGAEDILQEAFIKIFTSLSRYRFEGSLEGWVRRIVINTALKTIQKRKIRFVDIQEGTDSIPAPDIDALASLGADDLLKLIGALPDGYRIIFNLSVIEGYDHTEIGALLGISPATSRSQLLKARRALQIQFENRKKLPNKYAS
jgi:RNA polymerase sigma-70 factor (ECF subfamily)